MQFLSLPADSRRLVAALVVVLTWAVTACSSPAPGADDPPALAGALALRLTTKDDDQALLTWLEPIGKTSEHRLRLSTWGAAGWSPPQTVVQGSNFLANWADVPGAASSGGRLFALWLEELGAGGYGIRTASSEDSGATWRRHDWLQDDSSGTEYGFASYAPTAGGVQAFWLDGRRMLAEENPSIELRTALLDSDPATPVSTLLDARVCECCSTDAAAAASGPLVVYRDRGEDERRDIALIRWSDSGWSRPIDVAVDDWRIHGCPVNGPAVAAADDRVAVVWFTAAGGTPRVQLAVSEDGGASFAAPRVIDEDSPVGRVDVAIDPQGRSWVLWMGRGGTIRYCTVGADGALGQTQSLARTGATNASGFPKLALAGDRLLVVWRQSSALRAAILDR